MKFTNEGAPPRGPFRGQFGTCFRHALAAALDMEIGEVPDFSQGLAIPDRTARRHEQMREVREWLEGMDKTILWFPLDVRTVAEALQLFGSHNRGQRYGLYGGTAWKGLNHTVCCLGEAVEFSPGVGVDIVCPAWPERKQFHVWVIGVKLGADAATGPDADSGSDADSGGDAAGAPDAGSGSGADSG